MRLRFKKIDAGNYQASGLPTTLDGEPIEVEVNLYKTGSYGSNVQWIISVEATTFNKEISHHNVDSKREAVAVLQDWLTNGFYSDWDLYGYNGDYYPNPPTHKPPKKPEWGNPPWMGMRKGSTMNYSNDTKGVLEYVRDNMPECEDCNLQTKPYDEHDKQWLVLNGTNNKAYLVDLWEGTHKRVAMKKRQASNTGDMRTAIEEAVEPLITKGLRRYIPWVEENDPYYEKQLDRLVDSWVTSIAQVVGDSESHGTGDVSELDFTDRPREIATVLFKISPEDGYDEHSIYNHLKDLEESVLGVASEAAAWALRGATTKEALWPFGKKNKLPPKFEVPQECLCDAYGLPCAGKNMVQFEKTENGWKVGGKDSPLDDDGAKRVYESCQKKAASVRTAKVNKLKKIIKWSVRNLQSVDWGHEAGAEIPKLEKVSDTLSKVGIRPVDVDLAIAEFTKDPEKAKKFIYGPSGRGSNKGAIGDLQAMLKKTGVVKKKANYPISYDRVKSLINRFKSEGVFDLVVQYLDDKDLEGLNEFLRGFGVHVKDLDLDQLYNEVRQQRGGAVQTKLSKAGVAKKKANYDSAKEVFQQMVQDGHWEQAQQFLEENDSGGLDAFLKDKYENYNPADANQIYVFTYQKAYSKGAGTMERHAVSKDSSKLIEVVKLVDGFVNQLGADNVPDEMKVEAAKELQEWGKQLKSLSDALLQKAEQTLGQLK